jgi:hypothetical protein
MDVTTTKAIHPKSQLSYETFTEAVIFTPVLVITSVL